MRVPPEAGWLHAMNRAAPGSGWLSDRAAAAAFVADIGEACRSLPIDVHAYCVLPRHYHLLVRAELPACLAAVGSLEAASGLPAASRARAVPVSFGRHLMSVSRYIHLNPVDAGLVWNPEHWPYSSFLAYLGDRSAPRFLATQALLGRFGTIGARHRHRAYVYAGMDPGTRDRDGRPHWSGLFPAGSPAADLAWRIEPVLEATPPWPRPMSRQESAARLCRLADGVAAAFDVPVGALRSARGRGAPELLARGAFLHGSRAAGGHRLADVAAFMGYALPASAAAAAVRFERALCADPVLAAKVSRLLEAVTSPASEARRAKRPAPCDEPCPASGT